MGEKTMEEAIRKNWAPHPGEYIREEIEARGWSQRDLAYILGSNEQALNTILSGKRGISPEMAKALGDAFNVPAELFSNLQKSYELAQARDPDPGVAKRARLQSQYPVREMIKRGWLEETDASMLEAQIVRFFEVQNIDEAPHMAHAAKKTNYFDEIPAEQAAWLYRVKHIAKAIEIPHYSENALRDVTAKLKQFLVDPEEVRRVPRILMEAGVRFVLVEPLPGSKIDGACFWLRDAPVIGMSSRLDRIDNFWFVLRHEIEHALKKHGQDNHIIDAAMMEEQNQSVRVGGAAFFNNENAMVMEEEEIANSAAGDFCVPSQHMNSFIARHSPFFSERDIIGLARITQRHPGLIVGQLHAKTKRYELLRKYLVKVRAFLMQGAIADGWGQAYPVTL
jgi:HTH-type transcriptional regulator/antitoxin HigA